MTARESELVSIVLEPAARAALVAVATGQRPSTAAEIARSSSLKLRETRVQLDRLVDFGLVRRQMRDKRVCYQIETAFLRSL